MLSIAQDYGFFMVKTISPLVEAEIYRISERLRKWAFLLVKNENLLKMWRIKRTYRIQC